MFTNLHCIYEHASQAEWNLLRKLFSCHGHFKAVAEVDVSDLTTHSVQHQVGRMPDKNIK